MTIVAKLRYSATDFDLDGTDAASITSWVAKTSRAGEDVIETMTVRVADSSDDALATEIQKIDDLILRVDRYRDNPSYATPVWLHAKRYGETGERRALVKHLGYEPITAEFAAEANAHAVRLQVEIVRSGYWEDTAGQQFPGLTTGHGASVEWDYTQALVVAAHDVVGDVPARIGALLFDANVAGVDKVYCGIRSAGVRQVTNFENIWECEDGTNTARGADDAVSEVNLASPGSAAGAFVIGTPSASDTWEEYFTLQLGDVYAAAADFDAGFGTFLWLLRAKVTTAANVFQVQLRWGYNGMADADYVRGPIAEVTNTAWDYTEMGVQKITLRDYQILTTDELAQTYEELLEVQVWVRRTSGASTLKLDCLCPIAVDEGYMIFKEGFATGARYSYFAGGPDGSQRVYSYAPGAPSVLVKMATLDAQGFALPPGDGRMDIVYTRDGSSILTDTIAVSSAASRLYYERWRSLRGSET